VEEVVLVEVVAEEAEVVVSFVNKLMLQAVYPLL
jgi:hypothetical protein